MRRIAGMLVLGLLVGCGTELPRVSRPPVVAAVYDPARGELPTPNDLARDESGAVAIAPNPLLSDAENALKATMNGRDGFSQASTARVTFTGDLDPATVTTASVLAFDLGVGGASAPVEVSVARAWAGCDRSVTLSASTGFLPGHTYLFAVRGGAGGVRGAAGEEVVASPAFYFLRAGKDLNLHAGAMPGATPQEKRATAARLEAVRQKLEPHLRQLELAGIPRAELAAAWVFSVHARPEGAFDPAQKKLPFPNDLLKDAKTGLVALPSAPEDSESQRELKENFNTLDGFALTAALSLEATAPLDPASVTAQTVRLFTADGVEHTALTRTVSPGGRKLVLQPTSPLLPGTRYVALAFGLKDTQGRALEAMPLSSVLALAQPLVDADGASRISSFCADTAQRLEPLRAAVAGVIEANRLPRAEVSLAWAFTTQDVLKRARELWLTPYQAALPLEVLDAKAEAASFTQPNLSKVVTGKLWTWQRLDRLSHGFLKDGSGRKQAVDFMLTVPKGVPAGQPAKVVVFGHGLYTERRLVLLLADRLAKSGFASIAIDYPYHGNRSACVQDLHCELGAKCQPDGTCQKNGQMADLARGLSIPGIPGEGTPSATGQAFIDVEHLPGTRDNFRQVIIDLSALVRLVRGYDWKPLAGVALDGSDLHWVGISLGGITGASYAGIDPYLRSALLNVPGAGLVDLMLESLTFKGQLETGLKDKGIERGTPEWDAFLNAAKWTLDEVDPINLSPFARARPLRFADPATGLLSLAPPKALRIQMATGDTVVPNTSTRRLLVAAQLDEDTEFRAFLGSHGFLADPVEPVAMALGQEDVANFLEKN